MANLLNYSQPFVLYLSTGSVDTTGVALTLATGGSTGTGTFASGFGGYPFTNTGGNPAISLAGADGVLFTAIWSQYSTGTAAIAPQGTLQIYAAQSSTSSSTTWVAIKDAYAMAYSTGGGAGVSTGVGGCVVDVYRPNIFGTANNFTALGAIFQGASSGNLAITALRYSLKNLPPTASTVQGLGAVSTGRTNRVISVNGTT